MSDEREFSNIDASRQSFNANNIEQPYQEFRANESSQGFAYKYPNQTYEDQTINSQCGSVEEKFLEHSKRNFDLVPSLYRNSISNFDRISTYSGLGFTMFNLFAFVKFYPDVFKPEHINFILKPSFILLGLFALCRFKVDQLHRDSYRHLRETNSEQSISSFIDRYYKENLKIIELEQRQASRESDQINENI